MGTITSNVGLVSGLQTKQIIDQLIAIDSAPIKLTQNNVSLLQTQQTAFSDISAKLMVLKLATGGFAANKVFKSTSTTSSNPSVLSATSSNSATPGSYSFTVDRLVTTQQVISRGFTDQSSTPVGAGTLSFDFGDSALSSDTALSRLNGGAGVPRGKIRITDRSGSSSVVDLSKALTVNDVLDAINNTSGINVKATVSGDKLKLTDNTGAVATTLSVSDVSASGTTAALGLNAAAVGNVITGGVINTVSRNTQLAQINDGLGVQNTSGLAEFRVTRRDGTTFDVNLDNVTTLGGVIDKINTASGGNVTASLNTAGNGLKLVDSTVGATTFAVTNLNGTHAAADLGILASAAGGTDTINGSRVVATLNSKLIHNLKGGSGATLGTVSITNRAGAATSVDLSAAQSVQDILDSINNAATGVTASLNSLGNGLLLTDTTGLTASNLIVSDVSGTGAATLGLAQSVATTTIDSGSLHARYLSEATLLTSLNGGLGMAHGKFTITDSAGNAATVDLSQNTDVTINDVLQNINSRGLQINARINDNGNGIVIQDTGPGTVAITVAESGSTTARDLGILGSATAGGQNFVGSFNKTVTITGTQTLTQVAQAITDAGIGIKATVINDGSGSNQYRLSLTSTNTGKAGKYLFDDNGLGLGASTLVEAHDAVVFYGSTDPAKAIAITSANNALTSVIPGATVNLLSTSSSATTISINRDDSQIVKAVQTLATNFNSVVDTINKYDTYNSSTQQKGLLLGDNTVRTIRAGIYSYLTGSDPDVTGRYKSFTDIGITIGAGAKLVVDTTKLQNALNTDHDAVEQLFTLKTTVTDPATNTTRTTAGGVITRLDDLLTKYTDSSTGTIQTRSDAINSQIDLGNKRIDHLNQLITSKRTQLETQFNSMEIALANLQSQSTALNGFINSLSSSSSTSSSK